jgi:hypothetical protein
MSSSQSKRQASSPAEKLPSTKKMTTLAAAPVPTKPSNQAKSPQANQAVQDPTKGSLIRFEVVGINEKSFYGTLSEIEIIYIWEKVLGRDKDEIFAMSYSRSLTRNFKVTFKLKAQVEAADLYPVAAFEYHRKKQDATSDDDYDVITCRFIGYLTVKPAEIGQFTRITVKTNDFTIEPQQIVAWLSKFGSVNAVHDYEKNSVGLRTDVLETEILLRRHIPEYLPIAGRKAQVSYPGIPKACNNCYTVGHMKRNCKSKKRDWIHRVAELRKSGEFEDELFGGWIAILDQMQA